MLANIALLYLITFSIQAKSISWKGKWWSKYT